MCNLFSRGLISKSLRADTGPHSAHVPKRFSAVACTQTAAAAALGFAVVFIDGRGTGLRSRAFREQSHKNLGDGAGGPDHPHVIRAMAKTHSYMDLDNIGIWCVAAAAARPRSS